MSTDADTQAPLMSYGAWAQFLKRSVAPEFEPRARRKCRRYPIQATAKVAYEIGGKPYKRTWQVIEMSLFGMMVKTQQPVPVETHVALQLNLDTGPRSFQGVVVVHSTQTLGGYKIGLELQFPEHAPRDSA